jgi:hypothetical protein
MVFAAVTNIPIRSGKADEFGTRWAGHHRAAKAPIRTGGSELYTQYPSKELQDKEETNPVRRGWFEDLYFGVSAGFDRTNPDTVAWLTTDVREGGLFDWRPAKAALRRRDRGEAKRVRLIAVSYLLECVYGLLLDPRQCISLSGGFEKFLHEYGGAHNVEGEDGGVVEKGEDDDE